MGTDPTPLESAMSAASSRFSLLRLVAEYTATALDVVDRISRLRRDQASVEGNFILKNVLDGEREVLLKRAAGLRMAISQLDIAASQHVTHAMLTETERVELTVRRQDLESAESALNVAVQQMQQAKSTGRA